jgi:flagellin
MALGVLNNISAVYAENNLNQTQASLQNTLQQLSSGSRINSGADDAAGLSIANGLQANSAALTQSSANATAGVGFLQVADGALSQVTNLLNRAVTLATEAGGGTLSSSQISAANQEYQDILTQIGTIGTTTEYNGISVFSTGTGTAATINTPAAGAALTFTSVAGDTLSGSVTIGSTLGAASGSTVVNMGDYSGLLSSSPTNKAAAIAALTSYLDTNLGGQTGSTYTVASAAGVISITPSSGTEVLAGTNSTVKGWTSASGSVSIFASDGSAAGASSYNVTVGTLSAASVGVPSSGGGGINLGAGGNWTTQTDAQSALTNITSAITDVAYQRGQVGANINTLTAASNIANSQETNVSSAENSITATDYASATSNMSKFEILTQTGISALAQANSTQQMVTKLLQ